MDNIQQLMTVVYPTEDFVVVTVEFDDTPAVKHKDGMYYTGVEYVRTFIQNGLAYRHLEDTYFIARDNVLEIGIVVNRDLYYTNHCIGSVLQHVRYKRMTIKHQK